MNLFENIALTDDSHIVAHRKASAVANKRVKDQFGTFMANSTNDRASRLSLIEDDVCAIVASVVSEYGGDAENIEAAIMRSLSGNADHLKEYQFKKKDENAGELEEEAEEAEEEAEEESENPKEASVKEARRPKMCPYHSEVTDISLGSDDPRGGYDAMSVHAWGDKHCKGGYVGTCNFKPAMVTKKYWDDKKQEYEQRALERQQPTDLGIDTEPIMDPQPLEQGDGEGVTELNEELAQAPSAVGGGESIPTMQMAAHTAADAPSGAGGAVVRESLPSADESGLGGPSPKIDKGNSGDERGWTLDDIDTETTKTPHPNVEQDITEKAKYDKEDFLDQTDAVTKQQDLPSNSGDAGFDDGKENHGPNTDTWTGTKGIADPVTQQSLSSIAQRFSMPSALTAQDFVMLADAIATAPGDQQALAQHFATYLARTNPNFDQERFIAAAMQGGSGRDTFTPPPGTEPQLQMGSSVDPDKNPIRELLENEFDGFVPMHQVQAAIRDFRA